MRDGHRVSVGGEGTEDLERVDVALDARGHAFFSPVEPGAVRRLTSGQRMVLADVQHHALEIEQLERHLDELVLEARSEGVSWAVIGWSVGLTSEGARQRWTETAR